MSSITGDDSLEHNFTHATIAYVHHLSDEDPSLVNDKTTEEADTLQADLDALDMEQSGRLQKPDPISKKAKIEQGALRATLQKASEQVIVPHTIDEYRRLWNQFVAFCIETDYVADAEALDELIRNTNLPGTLPTQIALWIMHKCDETDIFTGKPKPLSESRKTYPYAQKMRAAISHKFGRELQQGARVWEERPMAKGSWTGNPSLSFEVSQYMISLRRRKTRAGEVVHSARAIVKDTICRLVNYNKEVKPVGFGSRSRKRKAEDPDSWAERDVRIMLNLIYTVAFLCLLRFDEVLKIEWHWLELEVKGNTKRLRLNLPFRKTHQTGGIAPFFLYEDHNQPDLDPVLAYSLWVEANKGLPLEGFVFRKKVSSGCFSQSKDQGMSLNSFLECFRNNMIDISVDPRMYGTHSFRRGGCQYLASDLRWPIRKICDWGGWSENQDTGTIFKYLLSWTDQGIEREDFFNPDKQTGDYCASCGRTCLCA